MGASRNLRALVPVSLLVPSLLALSPAAAGTVGGTAAHASPASSSSVAGANVASGIVFFSDRDSTPEAPVDDLYVIDPPTGIVTRLVADPGLERWPTLSPDGRQLAWVRIPLLDDGTFDESRSEVYRCTVGLGPSGPVCSTPVRVAGPVLQNAIAWAPDSTSVVYSGPLTAEGDSDLYVVPARGGVPRALTAEAVDGQAALNVQPSVSAVGGWVYWTRGAPTPTGGDLYRVRLNGSQRTQLTAAPFNDVGVDVSPDGRRLVFHANRDGGDFDIWTMRAAPESASNPARDLTAGLTDPTGTASSQERRPSWSPDGTRIAFWWFTDPVSGPAAGFTDSEIYVMRPDGSRVRNLTANNPAPGDPPPATLYSDLQPDWGRLRLTPVT